MTDFDDVIEGFFYGAAIGSLFATLVALGAGPEQSVLVGLFFAIVLVLQSL